MAESTDDAPDYSRDNALKKIFRNVSDWMFTQDKPTPREDLPWYMPNKIFNGWFDKDPIVEPPYEFGLEREYQYR